MKRTSFYAWLIGMFNNWNTCEPINLLGRSLENRINFLNILSCQTVFLSAAFLQERDSKVSIAGNKHSPIKDLVCCY